jgi:Ca2+-binding EF-hand superfamily protein
MRRFLIRALPAVAFVLLTSWLIAGEANPPAPSASKGGEDDVQDFVFLAEARPLLVRLHVRVDGKPLPAAWDAFMKHVFAFLDVNGDGVLSQQEAERAPKLGSGQGGLGGFLQGGSPSMKELDTDKDSKVSLAELSAHYRKNGFVPFQFQLDMSPPPGNAVLALYMGGMRPDPEVTALSKAIFALLDTDKDGKLSQKELDAAPAILLAKDENEDEIITGQELVPEEKPKGNMMAMMAMAIPKGGNAAGNKYLVPIPKPGQAPPELAGRMAERYDPGAKKPFAKLNTSPAPPAPPPVRNDSKDDRPPARSTSKEAVKANDKSKDKKPEPEYKLTRKQLGFDEATFARLDANKDGVLNNKELAAFVQREPDLCFVVSFGDKAGKPLALGTVAGKPAALADEIHFQDSISLVDLGKTRLELRRDADKRYTNRYMDIVKPQFTALFKSADKDNNGYLDEKEAKKSPFFGNIFKQIDRDGDGKITEKELLAYFDNMMDLENRAKNACVTLVLRDQSRGLFDLLDSDRDGRLSVREINQAPKLLARPGSKGFLRKEEIPPCYQLTLRRGPARPGGSNQEDVFVERYFSDYEEEQAVQHGPAWFRKMDRNRDGDVSRKEFLFSDELFRKIDTDGDGLISLQEAKKAGDLLRNGNR